MTVLSALVLNAMFRSASVRSREAGRHRSEAKEGRRVVAGSNPKAEPPPKVATLTRSDSSRS